MKTERPFLTATRTGGARPRFLPLAVLAVALLATAGTIGPASGQLEEPPSARVCPPFFLKDKSGRPINPLTGENANAPYSPRQTCGSCHDYDTITQGYHFQQGADEMSIGALQERCKWQLSPGNYGGAWCSPAPLYSYLSKKDNADPRMMDMTSFTFITKGCGSCHPGGGPLEFDREGKRYDAWMADPASGFTPGGDNRFDGDYYLARWSESGVLEADCLLCHLPDYDYAQRNRQIALLNFRWAPTVGAGLATLEGSIAESQDVTLIYRQSLFSPDGRVQLPMVVSPRNEACLSCHAQPGWKKRGADYRARTDVHLRAGMRCVDCHPAGSRADDPRIRGKEVHQIAKGDDPGGRVRDDLDNTVRDCDSCHTSGEFGAPIARHPTLPPLHLDRIACQTCHTPEKQVMPIQYQASDVFNDDALIPAGGKQLWTFYGVDGRYRNHYGILGMMGYDDKPSERFRPALARYKGKIYPVNRVHSSWPGIETPGQDALMQPRMSDIHKMWMAHRASPDTHAPLSRITDDNGDGIIEVNRPEEIDAIIAAISAHLNAVGYPLEGKRVVWVSNNRVYRSGEEYRVMDTEPWEASAYGNVHKYNHDIQPAQAALGAGGCGDCHRFDSPFFNAPVLVQPFDTDQGQGVWAPNHEILGISRVAVAAGAFREGFLKPASSWFLGAVVILLLLHLVVIGRPEDPDRALAAPAATRFTVIQRLCHFVAVAGFVVLAATGLSFLQTASLLQGSAWRDVHAGFGLAFGIGWAGLLLVWFRDMTFGRNDFAWFRTLGGYFGHRTERPSGAFNGGQKLFFWATLLLGAVLVVTGVVLLLWRGNPASRLALFYTIHDAAALFFLALVTGHLYLAAFVNPQSLRRLFIGSPGHPVQSLTDSRQPSAFTAQESPRESR